MKNINPLGLFDDHFLLEKLTKLGDPLQKLNEFIDWEIFGSPINEAFKNEDRDLSKGGRPPFNRLILFKILDAAGVFANEGKMADASFVKVPRQRNIREENKHIKETGTVPHEWKVKPHKLAQKDHDCLRHYFVVTSYGAVAYRERRGTTSLCG